MTPAEAQAAARVLRETLRAALRDRVSSDDASAAAERVLGSIVDACQIAVAARAGLDRQVALLSDALAVEEQRRKTAERRFEQSAVARKRWASRARGWRQQIRGLQAARAKIKAEAEGYRRALERAQRDLEELRKVASHDAGEGSR